MDKVRSAASKLRFQHLELLVVLRDTGSLHGAARVLHLTQSSLSKALSQIEEAFNGALFVREARGLRPTPTGAVVIEGAARMLRELAHLEAESAAAAGARILRIGALPFVAAAYLPAILRRLDVQKNKLRVQLSEAPAPALVQALLAGELDALLTSQAYEMIELPEDLLRYERLFDSEHTVICGPGHPLARARSVSWHALAREPWILPSPASLMRRLVDEAFLRAGLLTPAPVIEFSGPVTNVHLVSAGLGVSAVPAALLKHAEAAGEVLRLKVAEPLPRFPIGLVYRSLFADDPRLLLLRRAMRLP